MKTRWTVLVCLAAVACGPSFQAVYECDERFEHCYALDQRPVPLDVKKGCWGEWLHGYTYGQSRDRVDYAQTRFARLSEGPPRPFEQMADPPPRRVGPIVAAPVPTNAFAPPPNLAASAAPSASASPTSSGGMREALRAPDADCSDGCAHRWTACRQGCADPGCDECDHSYKTCVPACFRDDASVRTQAPRSVR